MTETTTFGDQLEVGLTADQLQTNAKTFRHIWFVQRFLLTCADDFLSVVDQRTSAILVDQRPTLTGLLHAISAFHRASYADVHYAYLSSRVDDTQLSAIIDNTRRWLNRAYPDLTTSAAFLHAIHQRCLTHDQSKLVAPEVQTFTDMTAKLGKAEYGSAEYKGFLRDMKPALDNHYAENRHHPEHFRDGLEGMHLIDVLEMLCDWAASSLRTKDGHILKSLAFQKERFGMSGALGEVLQKTYEQVLATEYRRDPADFYSQRES